MQAAVLPPLSYSVVVPVLSGGQVKDLDPPLVSFLKYSWIGQVGPDVSGGQVGDLDLSG